jgi:hypothetical protein
MCYDVFFTSKTSFSLCLRLVIVFLILTLSLARGSFSSSLVAWLCEWKKGCGAREGDQVVKHAIRPMSKRGCKRRPDRLILCLLEYPHLTQREKENKRRRKNKKKKPLERPNEQTKPEPGDWSIGLRGFFSAPDPPSSCLRESPGAAWGEIWCQMPGWCMDCRCEDGRLQVSASWVTLSNTDSLSNGKKGLNPGIRS